MKFKKPTKKVAANSASMLAGATVGAMVSDALAELIPTSNPTYKRLAVMGLGVVGMLTVSGNDAVSEGAKGAFTGMAIQQGVKVTREGLVKALPASTTANSFVQNALEMNHQPAKERFLGLPLTNRANQQYGMPALGNPDFSAPEQVQISATSLLG